MRRLYIVLNVVAPGFFSFCWGATAWQVSSDQVANVVLSWVCSVLWLGIAGSEVFWWKQRLQGLVHDRWFRFTGCVVVGVLAVVQMGLHAPDALMWVWLASGGMWALLAWVHLRAAEFHRDAESSGRGATAEDVRR